MDLMAEFRQRRLLPFVSAYIVGGWGVVQVIAFLEERLMLSPYLVNLVGLLLLTLLPSIVLVAWYHGRPGRDRWHRTEKIVVPVNVAAAAALVFILFHGKDLGAATETVEIRDENGRVSERVIPKDEFRRRAIVFYFDNQGDPADDWLRRGLAMGLVMDMGQDTFIDVEAPILRVNILRREGYPSGLGLPGPLQRKVAREAHCSHYVSGSFLRDAQGLSLNLAIHETRTGHIEASHQVTGTDVFALIDEASLLLRRELGVPEAHIEADVDLPVAEISTSDLEAFRDYLDGLFLCLHDNDWEAARKPLEKAVELDPTFALAHSMLFAVYYTSGDAAAGKAAMAKAMEYLYRMSERGQFQIKAIYYYIVEPDMDKALAVVDMWTRLYPNDVAAYEQKATFATVRQDHDAAIAAYRAILEIDASQHQVLKQMADVYREEGDFADAEPLLQRYAELNPTDARSFTQLADLYLDAGRLEQAREALEQAQVVEPNRVETRVDLAEIDARLGRFDAADAALQALLESTEDPESRMDILGKLISVYEIEGRYAEALALVDPWCDLARELLPPGQAPLLRAIRLSRLVIPARAQETCRAFDELMPRIFAPNNRLVGIYRAEALIPAGRLDEASAGLDEAEAFVDEFNLEVLRPSLLAERARLAEARGELAESLSLMERVVAADPTDQRHLRYLGRLQRLTDHDDAALKTLQQALRLAPGYPVCNLELALYWSDRDHPDKARPYIETALAGWRRADPDFPAAEQARQLAAALNLTP